MSIPTWLIGLAAVSQAACTYDALSPLGSGVPTKLTFIRQPVDGTAQEPLAMIRVGVHDAQDKEILTATDEITLTLGNNPGGARLLGQLTKAASGGTASFTAVGVDKAATGYTLVASAAGLTSATSEPFAAAIPPFTAVPSSLFGGQVSSVAISPAPAGGAMTIFASVGNGVYKSVDRGASWTPATFGLVSPPRALLADARTAGVVYAAGAGVFLAKTTTSGDAWLDVGSATTLGNSASAIAINPSNPAIVYTVGSGLFRSADGGASWTKLTNLSFLGLSSVAVDATSTVYIATSDRFGSLGVARSRDEGGTWTQLNVGPPVGGPRRILSTPSALFVGTNNGVYRSTDGGDHWASVAVDVATALAYAPSAASRMYLGRPGGVSVSDDAGATFGIPVSIGDSVNDLAVDPTNHNTVYAGGRKGMYKSVDGGATWSFSSTGMTALRISSVAMAPTLPETVVAVTAIGVYQTTNGGASWVKVDPSESGIVRFDPADPMRAYLCNIVGFSISTNGGASFGARTPVGTDCTQLAFTGSTFFAAGSPGTRKSINSGADWTMTDIGASFSLSVALGDTLGSVVVTGTSKGIAHSTNGGTSYTYVTTDFVASLLSDPTMPTRVIAGLACDGNVDGAESGGGFRVSTDGGASFGARKNGPCVQQLADNASALYAAGGTDAYVSTDHGETWTTLTGPHGVSTTSIAASGDGRVLYLGTEGGLYRTTTGGL